MAFFAKAVATYATTLTFFLASAFVRDSFTSAADAAPIPSVQIFFMMVMMVGAWAAIPTLLIGAVIWAISQVGGSQSRWRVGLVSSLTALISMKVSTNAYADTFEGLGARATVTVSETVFLVVFAAVVSFAIWTGFPEEAV